MPTRDLMGTKLAIFGLKSRGGEPRNAGSEGPIPGQYVASVCV